MILLKQTRGICRVAPKVMFALSKTTWLKTNKQKNTVTNSNKCASLDSIVLLSSSGTKQQQRVKKRHFLHSAGHKLHFCPHATQRAPLQECVSRFSAKLNQPATLACAAAQPHVQKKCQQQVLFSSNVSHLDAGPDLRPALDMHSMLKKKRSVLSVLGVSV